MICYIILRIRRLVQQSVQKPHGFKVLRDAMHARKDRRTAHRILFQNKGSYVIVCTKECVDVRSLPAMRMKYLRKDRRVSV